MPRKSTSRHPNADLRDKLIIRTAKKLMYKNKYVSIRGIVSYLKNMGVHTRKKDIIALLVNNKIVLLSDMTTGTRPDTIEKYSNG